MRIRFAQVINSSCRESVSNTPDFIIGDFLEDVMKSFELAIRHRDKWYDIKPEPGWSNPDNRMREAIGATYAKACMLMDQGKDIRTMEFPIIADEIVKALTGKLLTPTPPTGGK